MHLNTRSRSLFDFTRLKATYFKGCTRETFARPKMIFDKLKKFDIVFDSPEMDCPPVFSSGDVVSGKVVLELSSESKVESLKLHAEGFAKVHWTESRSAGSSTAYTQNYSDEVEYLNRREVLLQAGQSFPARDDLKLVDCLEFWLLRCFCACKSVQTFQFEPFPLTVKLS